MALFLNILLFIAGLVLIIKGGDFFVDAAVWFAEVSGIPHFIIGATIVGLATSLPEILVSVIAAAGGEVEMATGNAIGSVTANTGLILGISLVFMPMIISRRKYITQIILLMISIFTIWAFGLTGEITIFAAIILMALFAVFVYTNITSAKRAVAIKAEEEKYKRKEITKGLIVKNVLFFVFGCAGIVGGSELLVNNGSAIAASLGVPERIISISAIAIGTCLPELVTTITAIKKKQASLSVGNILGSNIIDLTIVLPPCLAAYGINSGGNLPVSDGTLFVDLPVLFLLTLVCFSPTMFTRKFARWQGIVLLALYLLYIVYAFVKPYIFA